jgi:hypothetical protein
MSIPSSATTVLINKFASPDANCFDDLAGVAAAQYQPTRRRVILHGATKRRLRLSRQLVHLDEHDHLRVATVVHEDDTSGAEASHTLNRAEYPSRH